MGMLEKIISFVFPTSMILNQNHLSKYLNSEVSVFRTTMLFALPISIATYIGHYYFFDLPMGLDPNLWFQYRFGISGLCLIGFFFYFYKKNKSTITYKIPALIIASAICYFQTRTILWFEEVPYIFSFLFLIITSFTLRLSPWQSILYITTLFLSQKSIFWEVGLDQSHIFSAFFVSLIFGLILSSMKYFQVKVFVASETLFDEQKKNIEQNLEFTKTLKSFLPKKISERLDQKVAQENYSIHQAVDEVLRPRNVKIACLACDIRGYTKKTKENKNYILDSVIPMTRSESQIVEHFEGIPRKIGDLLFAYYDSDNLFKNVVNATITGQEIVLHELNENSKRDQMNEVRKQVILAVGEAYVGNIGGHDSALEITALGTPVNFLSRLENVVKTKTLLQSIPRDHIILSKETHTILESLNIDLEFRKYDLNEYGLKIKDFSEISEFFTLKASTTTIENLKDLKQMTFEHEPRIAS
jgi:class 3 adenylate cyclase